MSIIVRIEKYRYPEIIIESLIVCVFVCLFLKSLFSIFYFTHTLSSGSITSRCCNWYLWRDKVSCFFDGLSHPLCYSTPLSSGSFQQFATICCNMRIAVVVIVVVVIWRVHRKWVNRFLRVSLVMLCFMIVIVTKRTHRYTDNVV